MKNLLGTVGLVAVLSVTGPQTALSAIPLDPTAEPRIGHRVYVELLGAGLLYSLNYEVSLSDRAGLRFGVGGLPFWGATYVVGLVMPTVQIGRGDHKAVVGAGLGLGWEHVGIFDSEEVWMAYGIASIGYQYQPGDDGFFLRGSFTPFLTDQEIAPWGGLSVGTAF